MTEKNKKGFFNKLFSGKTRKRGCCNIQFEEVSDENKISENRMNENTGKIEEKPDITNRKKKSNDFGGCCG